MTAIARAGRRLSAAATSYLPACRPAIIASQLVSTATCLTPISWAQPSMMSTAMPFHCPEVESLKEWGSAVA